MQVAHSPGQWHINPVGSATFFASECLPPFLARQSNRLPAVFLYLKSQNKNEYPAFNDSAPFLMLLFCKRINSLVNT